MKTLSSLIRVMFDEKGWAEDGARTIRVADDGLGGVVAAFI